MMTTDKQEDGVKSIFKGSVLAETLTYNFNRKNSKKLMTNSNLATILKTVYSLFAQYGTFIHTGTA